MGASIEFLIAIVRAGDSHHEFGDSYDFVCTVQIIEKNTALISGAVGKYNRHIYKYILKILKEKLAITKVVWSRKNNKHRIIEKDI